MVYQEFTKEEARELGAFTEDALSEKDALRIISHISFL